MTSTPIIAGIDSVEANDRITATLPANLHLMPPPAVVIHALWPLTEELKAKIRAVLPMPDDPYLPEVVEGESMERIYESIVASGKGSALVHALLSHPDNFDPAKDKRWARLAKALADPINATMDFAAMCSKNHIPVREIIPYFADHQRAMAMLSVWDRTPALATQVMTDALREKVTCRVCRGKGRVWDVIVDEDTGETVMYEEGPRMGKPKKERVNCLECEGSGRVLQKTDEKAVEQALEMTGLITKGGPLVANNIYNLGSGVEETSSDVGKALNAAINVTPERDGGE